MANIPKAILDLLDNAKTAAFARSLQHSDLPANWADDPEIVDLAAKAWQEAGTDSPFFKAWFGKSKMLDENGNPQIVYHGTGANNVDDFAFDPSRIGLNGTSEGRGFYTAASPTVADGYSGNSGNVLELFSNMQKPLGLDTKNFSIPQIKKIVNESIQNEGMQIAEEEGERFTPQILRDTWISNFTDTYDQPISRSVNDVARSLNDNNDNALDIIEEMNNVSGNFSNIRDAVRKVTGYDGVHSRGYLNADEDMKNAVGDIFVHWFPEQVKSVNNRGTFNPADPNIMRTLAPLGVGTAAMAAALLGDGSEAEAAPAWRPPEEPGLEEPWWSPADLFVAPVGVAGKIPAKLLAMAADAPATIGISAALEKLFGK